MKYEGMTFKSAVGLAAPQTWAATLGPVAAAGAWAVNRQGRADALLFYLVLCAALLMQSAVNTLNDYYDYKKGTDNLENSLDPQEAVLVYHCLRPGAVLRLAAGFLAAAGIIGLYVTLCCGPVPLAVGCAGCLVIVFYSGGKFPISYFPVGELVSGAVMGGLLPMAVINVLTGSFKLLTFWQMTPLMLGVGLIMYTNNISDIEKDEPAGRRTLSVCLGRKRAAVVYRCLLTVWILCLGHMVFWYFPGGFCLYPLCLGFAGAKLAKQMGLSFVPGERRTAMAGITWLNLCTGLFYAAMMLADRAAV